MYNNIVFIPVRGGSKYIPLKNIKQIAGKPLVCWVVEAACECDMVDRVFVATDSSEIKDVVYDYCKKHAFIGDYKLEIVDRDSATCLDNASTESAMLEFASDHDFKNIALVQATSPLITKEDIQAGFEKLKEVEVDSVLSVVRQRRFIWEAEGTGFAKPVNYNIDNRPRRQEFDGFFVENGAFYITSKDLLQNTQNRIGGNVAIVEMTKETYLETDEPSDWKMIEAILLEKRKKIVSSKILNIKMFLTDVDGCLTDGGMYYSEKGDELKRFSTLDGMGISLLKKRGIIVGVITSENVELNRRRCEKLGLDEYHFGVKNKAEIFEMLQQKYNIHPENIAYMGDDINDLEVIKQAGLTFAPPDAVKAIKDCVDIITSNSGGRGAVREACDYILEEMGNRG